MAKAQVVNISEAKAVKPIINLEGTNGKGGFIKAYKSAFGRDIPVDLVKKINALNAKYIELQSIPAKDRTSDEKVELAKYKLELNKIVTNKLLIAKAESIRKASVAMQTRMKNHMATDAVLTLAKNVVIESANSVNELQNGKKAKDVVVYKVEM